MKNFKDSSKRFVTGFDAKTGLSFTAEVSGPSYAQKIVGKGYFVIVNPDSKHVSFSKSKHDICYGHIVSDIIHEYTNEQYCNDYRALMFNGDKEHSEWTVNFFNKFNKNFAVYELSNGQPYNFYNEDADSFIWADRTKATLYTEEQAESKRRELLKSRIENYQRTGQNYIEIHIGIIK